MELPIDTHLPPPNSRQLTTRLSHWLHSHKTNKYTIKLSHIIHNPPPIKLRHHIAYHVATFQCKHSYIRADLTNQQCICSHSTPLTNQQCICSHSTPLRTSSVSAHTARPIRPSCSKPNLEICISSSFSPSLYSSSVQLLVMLLEFFNPYFSYLPSSTPFCYFHTLYYLRFTPHPPSKCTFPWLIARQNTKSRKTLVYVNLKDKAASARRT